MNHKRRGVAIIFNHMNFDPATHNTPRHGTNADRDRLKKTLSSLRFNVKVYEDSTTAEINKILKKCSEEDHKDADCIFVATFSHGGNGVISSKDGIYKTETLWFHFDAKRCPSLAGKPKVFFIQACQVC